MDGTPGRSRKKKQRSSRMNINAALNNFASSASMHGIPRVINAHSVPAKVFWSLVCIGAFLTFIWTGANLLNQYYSYPKKVNVEIIQRPVPFPSVTVCNTDHLDLQVVDRLEDSFLEANESMRADEFEEKYQNYSTMTVRFLDRQKEISSESMQDYLEVLSRLGFVANVGPELSSKAGIRVEDFIVNCRFMDEDCNISQTFVKVFDPYYFNCFTFQPQRILKSKSTRLSGVEYGLSLLLYVGCTGRMENMDPSGGGGGGGSGEPLPMIPIPGMIESDPALVTGQGARVVVHSPRTMPLPTADGYDIPSGYSVSIGLRARENIRIGLPHGNCTKTDEGIKEEGGGGGRRRRGEVTRGDGGRKETGRKEDKGKRGRREERGGGGGEEEEEEEEEEDGRGEGGGRGQPYTYALISCQNECIQKMIMKTCHCIDNRIPILHPEGVEEGSIPFCLQLSARPDYCNSDGFPDDGSDLQENSQMMTENDNCDELDRKNDAEFKQRLECRKQVYENMTIRNPDAMDACGCHPPCRDIVYDTSNSLSMLPESRKAHAFYHIVEKFVEQMSQERKKVLKKKYGSNYREFVKRHTSRVNVHIADSNVIKTTESPDYDLIRLVSDIGGQLGLWIGISVITLVEVLQLCADIFTIIVYQGRRLKSDWKRELPKGKQGPASPTKAKDGGGLQFPTHHQFRHQHLHHQHLHRPLSVDNVEDDETTFEIDKMTSV